MKPDSRLATAHIAVDIGGTQIRAAAFSTDSLEPLKLAKIPTRAAHENAIDRIKKAIASVWPEGLPVGGIAVAAPGPIDPYNGIIFTAPNIPGWENVPLRRYLEEEFLTPVSLGNDANLATLGEWHYGAAQGHHYVLYLTVSTGIGGGVIIDDRLLLGSRGLGAELGHVTVQSGGPLCGCGQRGHLEALASGTAMCRWVEGELARGVVSSMPAGATIAGHMISAAANAGDELAISALARAGSFMGEAIASFLHIFNPTCVIIGGGVSQSGPLLMEPMRTALVQHALNPTYYQDLVLTTAALGDNAGLMGALALARTNFPIPLIPEA